MQGYNQESHAHQGWGQGKKVKEKGGENNIE